MAGDDDDEPIVSSSPLAKLLRGLQRVVFSKAAPIADATIFFFLVFLISVAGHTFQDVYGTRQLSETMKHRLMGVFDASQPRNRWPTSNILNHTDFKDIATHDAFWNYLQYNLADLLYPKEFYDGGEMPDDQKNMVLGHNVVVQLFRLRQKRVKQRDCSEISGVGERLNTNEIHGLKGVKCYPRYQEQYEDRGIFLGTEWTSDELLLLQPRNPLQHRYQGGSFAVEVPAGSNAEFKQKIADLKEKKWTDLATRAVFIDICVLNLSRDQFVSLRFEFEFTEYGTIVPKLKIRAYRDRLSHETQIDLVNYFSEFALYGAGLANVFREVGKMRVVGPEVYFSNIWNILTGGLLACLFMSMYYRVVLVRSPWNTIQSEATDSMKWTLDGNGQYHVKWDWDDLGENDTLIIKLQAFAMVLSYLKMFSFLQFFSKKIDDFLTSLSHSKRMLLAYNAIMIVFLFAFSIGLNLAFGVQEFTFSSVPLAALSLAELLFGNFDAQPLDADSSLFASLMLVSFFAILGMVSMSAILALVNWATREVNRGKVVRETDDKDANLKFQLADGVKRLVMSEYLGSVGRALRPLVEGEKQIRSMEDLEEEDDEAEEEEMQFAMISASKIAIKDLLNSVTELRTAVRQMCENMGVDFDEDDDTWRRDNWWRKFRNETQELQFQSLLNAVKTNEPDKVSAVIRDWKRTEGALGVQNSKSDINWRDLDGFSAMHYACLAGDPDMVNRLLDHKADPNARNDDGNSCLHLAALSGKLNACRVLVEMGQADFDDVRNNAHFTPFHMAAYGGHTSICKYLGEELQADAVCQTSEGLTPLHLAVIQHHDETVEYMVSSFPQALDSRANGGETALHVGVLTNKDVHLLRILLKGGCKVGEKMYDGENVYQVAVKCGREAGVQRLLHRVLSMGDSYQKAFPGLDERASGMSLIKFASMGMHKEMELMLLEGADIDAMQPGAGTALHAAVKRRLLHTIEFLLDAGADVHAKDTNTRTPLQIAVESGYFEGYELMANTLSFENLPIDADGNTLLHLAASVGNNMKIVQHLVSHHKIDPLSCNHLGQTCFEVAQDVLRVQSETYGNDIIHLHEPRLHEKILHYFTEGRDEYEDSVRRPLMPGEDADAHGKSVVEFSKRIVRFFENIGLQKDAKAYARLLADNEVDFDGLFFLQDAHLKELGIVKLGIRNKILVGISQLQARRKALGSILDTANHRLPGQTDGEAEVDTSEHGDELV